MLSKRGVGATALLVAMAFLMDLTRGNEDLDANVADNSVESILGNGLLSISEDNSEDDATNSPNATPGWHLFPDDEFLLTWTPPPLPEWLRQALNESVAKTSPASAGTAIPTEAPAVALSTTEVTEKPSEISDSSTSSATTKAGRSGGRFLGINPFLNLIVTTTSTTTTTRSTTSSLTTPESAIGDIKKDAASEQPEANLTQSKTTTAFMPRANATTTFAENVSGLALNATNSGQTYLTQYRMCGYPAICDQEACAALNWTQDPLKMCEIPGSKGGFIFTVLVIALAIIFGNLLLPLVVWKNRELRTQHNLTKVSLSIADIITGLILLFSVIPNIVRTMDSTEQELGERDAVMTNSAEAVVAGSTLTLSAQASLFHLTYLSVERFVAIKWPLWHRFNGPQNLSLQIAAIWGISVIAAYVPAAFTDHFSYRYLPALFIYLLSATTSVGDPAGVAYIVLTMAIPFAIMICFTLLTGITVWLKMRSSQPLARYSTRHGGHKRSTTTGSGNHNAGDSKKGTDDSERQRLKPEVAVFMTLGIMIVGFCLTLLPFIIVFNLFYSGYYNCSNYAVPYAAAFYAGLSNSFINPLVYTVRDEKFRTGLKRVFSRGSSGRWNTHKSKSATMSTSLPSPHPMRMKNVSAKERWEQALIGQ